MIRMIQSNSAGHAQSYFKDELTKSDYYLEGEHQELPGRFQGRLADRLGLGVEMTKEAFNALTENLHPISGNKLTPRTKDDRTVGYDINFHCPKSMSILHALSSDNHLLDAFQDAVSETMRDIESDSKTRVRLNGVYDDRETGELVWGEFIHQTARPVDGSMPDPHLHCHAYVFNCTYDAKEDRFKAAQFRDIMRDMPYYQARFHKRLADRLQELGYGIRRTDKAFEIENVPQQVIDLFSKRTDAIGRVAKEKGITDDKQKSELGARTRSKKMKGLTMSELKADWRRQIKEVIVRGSDEGEKAIRFSKEKKISNITVKDCIDHTIKHSFERASVKAERRLLERAYRHGIGQHGVSLDNITSEFRNDHRIIQVKEKDRVVCTTKHVLAEEKEMVDLARKGKGQIRPLYTQVELPSFLLNDQQTAAVNHILTTSDQVSIIRGAAGTGKTTLMKEAISYMEKGGRKVNVLAPTSQASRGVLKDEGFNNAATVAQFLSDKDWQHRIENQALWIDEAGLLGTSDMTALLRIARAQNVQLILGGDTRQHSSVARGDALRVLNMVADIKTAEVSKIYRQKDYNYKMAVEDLAKGDIDGAFKKLDGMNAIKQINPLNPHAQLVNDYFSVIKSGKSALVISPTHEHRDQVNNAIREKLKIEGHIDQEEIKVNKLINLNLTEAEKSDSRNYKEGQTIQFNQNVPSIKRGSIWQARGSIWQVVELKSREVTIQDETKNELILPIERAKCFDVYENNEMGLSVGDKINITKNGFDCDKKRLNNGYSLEVVSLDTNGKVKVQNAVSKSEYILEKDFGHWSHAHCITSYASQGKTVDEVFIAQPAATFSATDAKQVYVSVSRGRDKAHLYTDDKVALLDHASIA